MKNWKTTLFNEISLIPSPLKPFDMLPKKACIRTFKIAASLSKVAFLELLMPTASKVNINPKTLARYVAVV